MKRNATLSAALTVALLSLYGCTNMPDPAPFDPATLQRNSRQASQGLPSRHLEPIEKTLQPNVAATQKGTPTSQPTTAPTTGKPLSEDPMLRLALQEVLHRTVNNNMDIRVASYDPAVAANRIVEAESKFDPTFFFNPFYDWRKSEASQTNISLSEQKSESWGAAIGIRQDLENGGSAELRHETNEFHVPGTFGDTDFFSNNLVLELKQPLLRNFGTEVNRARITVSQNDQKISILDYRKKLEDTLFEAEQTYWQLVQAEEEVAIGERLLDSSEATWKLLVQRGQQDTTRIQTSQANSAVQNRRALLVRARSRVRDLSDQLKRLMNDPELPVASNVLVLGASRPLDTSVYFDAQDQINQALEHRLELAQQLLRLGSSSLITRVARNNMLPALQFVQTVTANGAAGGWDDANYSALDFDHTSYRAAFQFEIPIGNRQAHAIYQRTLLQRQQAVDQYRTMVDQVSLEVKTALRNVNTSWDEMAANRQAVLAAADAADAIELRMVRQEALDPTFVQLRLDSQARLADAERSESQAIATYSISIAALEKAKGTLLRYDNVLMEEDRLDAITRGKVLSNMPPLARPATTQSISK